MTEEVITLQGLYQAYYDCRKRKRHTVNAQRYEMQLLDQLYHLLVSLRSGHYVPSRSLCFMVEKPKAREIHAAHFTDRVFHHWLVPRLEAIYEPVFIHDVYSNRQGKGTHRAVKRLQGFMQGVGAEGYFMQLDIANFFNSIDRKILFKLLQKRLAKAIKQQRIKVQEAVVLRDLCHNLLKHNVSDNVLYRDAKNKFDQVPPHKRLINAPKNVGLPIGNLTSQFFANVYMNELDQFIKHQLKCRYYCRYVDDFILLSRSQSELRDWHEQIIDFLAKNLKLRLKEEALKIKPVGVGADFLGYITKPHYRLVRRRVVQSLYEKLCHFERLLLTVNRYKPNDSHKRQPTNRYHRPSHRANKQASHVGWAVFICPPFRKTIDSVSRKDCPPYLPHRANKQARYSQSILTLQESVMQKLQATLASYLGHFKHANSYRLLTRVWQQFSWLGILFTLEAGQLITKWQPKQQEIIGYKSQIAFFKKHYPTAKLSCQRGWQVDTFFPDQCIDPALLPVACCTHVIIKEQGYLKGGLKRRVVTQIYFYPSPC